MVKSKTKGINPMQVRLRIFLVRLLENPILLEHEFFTNLLRAVFHLTEELDFFNLAMRTNPFDRNASVTVE